MERYIDLCSFDSRLKDMWYRFEDTLRNFGFIKYYHIPEIKEKLLNCIQDFRVYTSSSVDWIDFRISDGYDTEFNNFIIYAILVYKKIDEDVKHIQYKIKIISEPCCMDRIYIEEIFNF